MRGAGDPLVTIGLPMLNPGPFLPWVIRSVFAQSYPHWELIILDDGSTDGSLELARRIRDPRVNVFSDGKNRGLPYRLNQILDLASGQFIARMDADDLMHPERIERQVKHLLAYPEADAVTTGAILIDRENRPMALKPGQKPSLLEVLRRGGYLHPSLMARADWYRKHRYSEAYPRAEDREFFVRTYASSRIDVLKEPLYFYRWYGNVRPKALLQGYASERRIMWRYGPKHVGWGATLILVTLSSLKSVAVSVGSYLKIPGVLEARGFSALPPDLQEEVRRALERIQATPVPGWDRG